MWWHHASFEGAEHSNFSQMHFRQPWNELWRCVTQPSPSRGGLCCTCSGQVQCLNWNLPQKVVNSSHELIGFFSPNMFAPDCTRTSTAVEEFGGKCIVKPHKDLELLDIWPKQLLFISRHGHLRYLHQGSQSRRFDVFKCLTSISPLKPKECVLECVEGYVGGFGTNAGAVNLGNGETVWNRWEPETKFQKAAPTLSLAQGSCTSA